MNKWQAVVLYLILSAVCVGLTSARPRESVPGQTEEQVYTIKEVSERAVILKVPRTPGTRQARMHITEGIVRLRAVFAASGEVRDVTVLQGLPDGLTEQAVESARGIKFTPARKDGRVVSQYAVLEYPFAVFYPEQILVHKAEITSIPTPEYTEEARRNGVSGVVTLEVALYSWGEVTVMNVVKGLPHGLTEKAIEAARKIKFKPAATAEGHPVSQQKLINFKFAQN